MKKTEYEKNLQYIIISMMIIIILLQILFVMYIIVYYRDKDFWGALSSIATAASAILIYYTLRETSNSNKKQLEMQTKIHLYEKRMKFREELITYNTKYYKMTSEIFGIKHINCQHVSPLLSNIRVFVKDSKSQDRDLSILDYTLKEILHWWKKIETNNTLDRKICSFYELHIFNSDREKLSLDAKLLFRSLEVSKYFENIKIIEGNLIKLYEEQFNDLGTTILHLMRYILKMKLFDSMIENKLTDKNEKLINDLILSLKVFEQNINDLFYFFMYNTIPAKWHEKLTINPSFEEVNKVIQEEAKLLS